MTKRKYEQDSSSTILTCNEDYIHDFDSVIITEFLLQLRRTKDTFHMEKTLHTLIGEYCKRQKDNITPRNRNGLELLYRAIHYIRDPIRGLGEYHLAYTCIWVWYFYYPKLAKFAFHSFLFQSSIDSKQIGSWKDVKYFSNYIFQRTNNKQHPLIQYACKLMSDQIKKDNKEYSIYLQSSHTKYYSNNRNNYIIPTISLASKWCPRENKKYNWIFKKIVEIYYNIHPHTKASYRVKYYRKFRKIIAKLNRYNDTLEINQCSRNWANIKYSKVPSCAWKRYILSFMNKNESKQKNTPDRKEATIHFYNYMIQYYLNDVSLQNPETVNKVIQRSTIEDKDLYDIVDVSVRFRSWGTLRPIIPNYIFRKKCSFQTSLPNFIPFLNIHSVENVSYTEMVNMISRVLYISEKTSSSLRNRILISVQNRMKWLYIGKEVVFRNNKVEIQPCTIMEKVDIIWDSIIELQTEQPLLSAHDTKNGNNTRIPSDYSTLQAIAFMIDSIIETGLENNAIEKLRFVYISDQDLEIETHMSIQKMFKNAGLRSKQKKEFPTPHIIVWKDHPRQNIDVPIVYPLKPSIPNMLEDYKLIQSHMIGCMHNSTKKVKRIENIGTIKSIIDKKIRYLRDGISFVNHLTMLPLHIFQYDKPIYSTKIMLVSLRQKRYDHLEYILNKQLGEMKDK